MEKKLYELTTTQQSILMTEEFASGTNLNLISGNIIIDAPVNLSKLEQAINLYVQKNEGIRLRIHMENGLPKQYVESYHYFKIPIVSLSSKNDLKNWDKEYMKHSFPFYDTDLFHFTLFQFANGHGGLNVTFHHIISDAWTLSLFITEVMDFYSSLLDGVEIATTSNPSYLSLLEENRKYLTSSRFQKDEEFWQHAFEKEPNIVPLVSNKSIKSDTKALRINFSLSSDLMNKINLFCEKNHCSINSFFLAIYSVYLYKLSNNTSPIIGMPVLNRTNFKEKKIAGMFISTIPFQSTLNPEESFEQFLKEVTSHQLSIFRHQKYPYSRLANFVKQKYHITENLFDVVLSVQNARDNSEESKIPYHTYWIFTGHILETLNIHFYDMDNSGHYDIYYDYQVNKLTAKEIETMHYRILSLINQVVSDSSKPIKKYTILLPAEKKLLLHKFNPKKRAVHFPAFIEQWNMIVKKNLKKTALVFENKNYTYEEIDYYTNCLANLLVEKTNPNDVIGILLSRSPDLVFSMIAILKAGCSYMIIDPTLPKERIEYMLKNSNCSIYVTNTQHSIHFDNIRLIELDCINIFSLSSKKITALRANQENLSVVYTSGSTGVPKGILLKRSSMQNVVYGYNATMHIAKYKTFLSICAISFDMFAAEIWIPLLSGKKLVLANEEEQKNPIELSELICKEKPEFMLITPSKLDILLSSPTTSSCLTCIKAMQVGGEVLTKSFFEKVKKHTNARIFDGYGPSETTVCCSTKEITKGESISIGRPYPNVQIYICNQDLNLCPVGVSGQLCIAGAGVSKGYINNQEATNKNFISNPFGDGLLYLSGDIAKYNQKGEIEFIGRNDYQVKLRGLRIELEEIDNALKSLPMVQSAVSIINTINQIDSICSYLVCDKNTKVDTIKQCLKEKLPYYMIPSYFMLVDSLPLNNNGKIDKKKLPKISIQIDYEPIQTETEQSLSAIWKKLLKVKQIGRNSDFFELGGDSLCAIKLITEIYNEFHVKLQIKDVFHYTTIQSLSSYIQELGPLSNKKVIAEQKTIPHAKSADSYPLSHAQKRIYLSCMLDKNSIVYNTPGGILFSSVPDKKKLESSIQTLINHHESLRTYFSTESGEIVQKISPAISYTLEEIEIKESEVDSIFHSFLKPFDLEKAPLFRMLLLNIEHTKAILLVDFHHIICDGLSLSIFIKELFSLYEGQDISFSNYHYKDFAIWEQKELASPQMQKHKSYWLENFSGELPVLNLPSGKKRPEKQDFKGNHIQFSLAKNIQKKLYTTCQELHVTPYVLLLSIYYILLYKYTGQKDIIVGSPSTGRTHAELENTIGMFVNTLPLRNQIDSSTSFINFLKDTMRICLEAFEHESYPYDVLIKDLNLVRDSSRNALFDTMFIYQNELPEANLYEPAFPVSKFDLSVEVKPYKDYLMIQIEYATALFDESFIRRFASHFQHILETTLHNPTIKISDIAIISEKEKELILYDYNNTTQKYNKEKPVISLFYEQANENPSKTAVVFENHKISYRDLNIASNQLAHFLISTENITEKDTVAIMLSRTPALYVAMLGVLKIGASYLLVDPSLPPERISYMLQDCNAKILLQDKKVKKIDWKVVFLEDIPLSQSGNENLVFPISNENTFCMIYTSGSTGKPKGVMLKNLGVYNMVISYDKQLHTSQCQTFISMSAVSFDMFLVETFVPLLTGKTIVLTNAKEQKIPQEIAKLLVAYHVDFILTTPSRMELMFLNNETANSLHNLKIIQLGGEVFTPSLYKELRKRTQASIYNGYGPSEITACCSNQLITDANSITIGKPMYNTELFICNQDLNLCPIGIPGEICVVGDGVSKGYLNNIEATQKVFVSNPFGNGKMYRTGDIGIMLLNREIRYLGRKDNQIKIHGLRIELSEIEKKLTAIPQIDKAVVLFKKEENNSYLSAFYTATLPIEVSQIRSDLAKDLPEYMIPNYFTKLEKFPLTLNGKIDTKLLSTYQVTSSSSHYVAPFTDLQKTLCTCLEKLLHNRVGIDDDIFELGADSLLIIKYKIELLSHNIVIDYSDVFQYKTIRKLAEHSKALPTTDVKLNSLYDYTKINTILEKNDIHYLKSPIVKKTNNSVLLLLFYYHLYYFIITYSPCFARWILHLWATGEPFELLI